ncbi:fumarylacetoacetate hydrolase family protein [Halegenticoccus tardaugens]|uniref:fumarylacetoacetate hydrolase family protein n=1 Tax=Halegenticoccus tardaugens TaxID=2071624 RepID=UPI00100B5253|nr:fumarylacetoacetate hydrolase family protein [Halegenticoccus tardaugens]
MTYIARTEDGTPLLGDEDGFRPLAAANPALTDVTAALRAAADGTLPDPTDATARPISAEKLPLTLPLETLGKLWGIGLNYAEHASDLNEQRPTEPASFMKPRTAAVGPGGPIRLPSRELTDRVTAEAELGVVVGRQCSDVALADVDDVIAGYVPVIDMTAEDILERNPRYLTRSKSFDSFIVIGPWIVTQDAVGPLEDLTVQTIVNDAVVAENSVDNMMTTPRELVSYHSRVMTLEPGDIISTGTPGAHVIAAGDTVEAAVERVGVLSADVVR